MTSPADLLVKMQHDLSRMEQELANSYPAFDFFITAEHLLDWLYPGDTWSKNGKIRAQKRQGEPLLRVTSHLANGAKHFQVTDKRHKSVDSLQVHEGAFDPKTFDPNAFDTERLIIELQGDEANAFGQQISAIDLARRVLAYWQQQLANSQP